MLDERDESLRAQVSALAATGDWVQIARLLTDATEQSIRLTDDLANVHAEALIRCGRPHDAREKLRAALAGVERAHEPQPLRNAHNLLGAANFELGDLADAARHFERAFELGQSDGDHRIVAQAANNLGAIANVRGERDRAVGMYTMAVAANQRLGNPRGLAHTYHNLAITFRHLCNYPKADEHERRAIEYAIDARNPHLMALARLGRAEISLLRGDARMAEISATRLAAEFGSRSDPIQRANALRIIGQARTALGDFRRAHSAIEEGLTLARRHGSALAEAELTRARAELHAWQNDRPAARLDAQEAIRMFTRLGAVSDRDRLARWLAAIESNLTPALGVELIRNDAR